MRNLNGFEIGGRILKVDNAANEKTRMEMQSKISNNLILINFKVFVLRVKVNWLIIF